MGELPGESRAVLFCFSAVTKGERMGNYRVSIITDNGTLRIHGRDCRDVPREAKKYRDEPWHLEASTRQEVNEACYGDIASDNADENTPEWDAEVAKEAEFSSVYLPCVPEGLV
ncbi:hypothetical protein [Streptomyces sp. NBC_01197]|uniref:hypothetical protein n=1 Tax=Streptomyces sp. NBC_01197 TaxID=2903768 RepID=UPI002E0E3537|nr:hypothetical protein OG452_05430 [Streptomyces sp. NBC_01197]